MARYAGTTRANHIVLHRMAKYLRDMYNDQQLHMHLLLRP